MKTFAPAVFLLPLVACGGGAFSTADDAGAVDASADSGREDAGADAAADANADASADANADAPADAPLGADARTDAAPTDASDDAEAAVCPPFVAHSDGYGGTWQDCAPLGTHDETEARDACNDVACILVACASGGQAVCGQTGNAACRCWQFSGSYAGATTTDLPGSWSAGCACPTSFYAVWR